MKSLLSSLLIAYLVLLLLVWAAVQSDTGSSWWVSLFLFSPRWALGLPWLPLFLLTLRLRPRLAGWYVVHLLILLFLLLDLRLPSFTTDTASATGPRLRLITFNLGEGPIGVEQLVDLVKRESAQVLVVQECTPSIGQQIFQQLGWEFQQRAGLAIGSNLPQRSMEIVSQKMVAGYPAIVAVAIAVQMHQGPAAADQALDQADATAPWVQIVGIHFPTFRPAFELAQRFDYAGAAEFRNLAPTYREYASQAEAVISSEEKPVVVAGDFNVPVESDFYRDYWSAFQNALSQRGWGWGYTKYTRLHGVRIDHVLADAQWSIHTARVGPDLGGDHRPVLVELQLKSP